jgi:2-polyprenyl-3-methyl-5-hydroxy-6-metoxy-1,4-benzoquinol methylase
MNRHKCECCQSGDIGELPDLNGFSHYRCNTCRFEFFISGRFRPHVELYEMDADYNDDLTISWNHRDLLQWNHLQAIKFLKNRYRQAKARTLDIGCFNGFFVRELLELGYDSYGIDFNSKAIEHGIKAYGLGDRIFAQDRKELTGENNKYDVITLFEVIEHLDNPREFLKGKGRLLKDNGVIIISAPNNKMVWRPRLDSPPHHLSRWEPEALALFVKSLGFRPIERREQMSLFSLARNYFGSFLRSGEQSLRGGEFKNKTIANMLRTALNRSRSISTVLLLPLDATLHLLGMRYISQIIFAEHCRK